jgi:ribosomal protein L40E
MYAPEMIKTVGLKQCQRCGAELLERDRFCRRCGVSQCLRDAASTVVTGSNDRAEFVTRPLPGRAVRSGSISGALVNLVTESVSEGTSSLRASRWTMRLAGALIIVPLWLMIALLSPLDAYLAAKSVAKLGLTR